MDRKALLIEIEKLLDKYQFPDKDSDFILEAVDCEITFRGSLESDLNHKEIYRYGNELEFVLEESTLIIRKKY